MDFFVLGILLNPLLFAGSLELRLSLVNVLAIIFDDLYSEPSCLNRR